MMYTVASYLVEKKSGLRFADFLEQRIFRPLQMRSTSLQPGAARAKGLGDRIATGYVWDDEAKTYEPTPWTDSPEAQGAGGIVTSVDDYVKWVKAVMNREPPITDAVYRGLVEKRILQDEDADEADDMDDDEADDFPLPDTPELYYAAGWEIRQYCGHMVVSHDGSEDGFRSNHFFVPDLRLGGVIVGNSNCAATVINMLTHRLIDETVRRQEGDAALQAYKHGSGSGSCSTCASDDGSGSGSDDGSDDEDEDGPERELMREHCPGLDAPQPLTRPLAAYTGRYWNPGYRAIRIAEADGGLVVDATDRSMGYKLRFKHLRDQTHFMAYLSERFVKGESPLKVEFVLEGDRAVRVGMCLEESVKDYIWFERKDG
ncbi:hypothetical protein CDD83_1738 [Cordyceps sp. RAO-2017]|nr:hypothetical protein CDD83_1738 [Cordyceps sp. RAO-2017]